MFVHEEHTTEGNDDLVRIPGEIPAVNLRRMLALSAILLTSAANAQIAADLRGRVLDPSGAAVSNASVELIKTSTNLHLNTHSSTSGDYVFTHLNPGSYSIEVTAPNFQRLTRSGVTVIVGQTATADLQLTVGSDTQTVNVTADAPLLQAQTSNI